MKELRDVIAISEMLLRTSEQIEDKHVTCCTGRWRASCHLRNVVQEMSTDKHGTCSAGRRRKDERAWRCHCKLRNAAQGKQAQRGQAWYLFCREEDGKMKELRDVIAISEMLLRTSEQIEDKYVSCSTGRWRASCHLRNVVQEM